MNRAIIRREIEIDAPVAQVWPLVATEAGLRQWWGSEITLEPQEGGRCTQRMMVQGKEVVHHGIVSVYAPPHELTLTFSPEPHSAAADIWAAPSRVSITLEPILSQSAVPNEAAERTRVAVVHHILNALPAAVGWSVAAPAAGVGPQMRAPAQTAATASLPQPMPLTHPLQCAELAQGWAARLQRLIASVGKENLDNGNISNE